MHIVAPCMYYQKIQTWTTKSCILSCRATRHLGEIARSPISLFWWSMYEVFNLPHNLLHRRSSHVQSLLRRVAVTSAELMYHWVKDGWDCAFMILMAAGAQQRADPILARPRRLMAISRLVKQVLYDTGPHAGAQIFLITTRICCCHCSSFSFC